MADQKRIKLGALHATPKTIIVRDLPVANAAATTKIYLYTTHATPKNVIMRDPTAAPIPAGDTVNGALSATLDALTLSSAGQVIIDGDLASTLGTLTLASAGQIVIDADEGATLEALTLSATGAVGISGALSSTLGALTLSSEAIAPAIPAESTSGPSPINRGKIRAKAQAEHAALLAAREAQKVQREVKRVLARRMRQFHPQNRRLARN